MRILDVYERYAALKKRMANMAAISLPMAFIGTSSQGKVLAARLTVRYAQEVQRQIMAFERALKESESNPDNYACIRR